MAGTYLRGSCYSWFLALFRYQRLCFDQKSCIINYFQSAIQKDHSTPAICFSQTKEVHGKSNLLKDMKP